MQSQLLGVAQQSGYVAPKKKGNWKGDGDKGNGNKGTGKGKPPPKPPGLLAVGSPKHSPTFDKECAKFKAGQCSQGDKCWFFHDGVRSPISKPPAGPPPKHKAPPANATGGQLADP